MRVNAALSIPALLKVLAAVGLLLLGSMARAHHSQIGAYDTDEVVVIDGVISRVRMASPHSVFIVALEPNDQAKQMHVESHARPLLIRLGLTSEVIKVGRRLVVRGHPSKAWPQGRIFALSLEFADGTVFNLDVDRVLIPLAD